jgi:EAL domain-containing protein (putative c-di-GMP-specific phosphodiesterase class I)
MHADSKDLALVQSVVTLARGLGVMTIAEYVEDAAVLDIVRREGISFAQGYHIGRPGPTLYPAGTPIGGIR